MKGELDYSEKEDMASGIAITIDGSMVAVVDGTDKKAIAIARHLCRCTNAYEPLLGASEDALKLIGDTDKEAILANVVKDTLKAAIIIARKQ